MKGFFSHISIFIILILQSILFSGLLGGCREDYEERRPELTDGYIILNLMLPIVPSDDSESILTRAEITESGSLMENRINSVSFYIVEEGTSNILIKRTNLPAEIISEGTDERIIYSVKSQIIPESFAGLTAGKKMQLYVVANNDNHDLSLGLEKSTFSYEKLLFYGEEGQYVPMSNKEISGTLDFSNLSAQQIITLFKEEDDFTLDLSTTSGGFGTIELQRGLARLDYKDKNREEGSVPNVYQLGNTGIYLKVKEIIPINVHNRSYLLRHSMDEKGSPVLFGNGELTADYDWADKTGFFNLPPELNDGWTSVKELTENDITDKIGSGYHPWCYVSENTLPDPESTKQGVTTGVAFKMILCDEAGKDRVKGDNLPSGVTIHDGPNPYIQIGSVSSDLTPEDDGSYSLTYYYFIRHKDNGDPGITGEMEFGVMRNTIYKLSIVSISGLPREYDPEEDVEEKTTGPVITVNIKVKPWDYTSVIWNI